MLNEIKNTIILGLGLFVTGFIMVIAVGFALVAAPVIIIKYRDEIRSLHNGANLSGYSYGV
jgi:hypothetical protein